MLAACAGLSQRRQICKSKSKQQSPVKAVEFIQAHHLSGPMLNDYPLGAT